MKTIPKLDSFTRAYIECALWSSTDNSNEQCGEPLDANYSLEDIAAETLAKIVSDCEKFQLEHGEALAREGSPSLERAGHDFWLTRNGHGAGFWDGDWKEPDATILTDASHAYGEVDLYVGDDGEIYT